MRVYGGGDALRASGKEGKSHRKVDEESRRTGNKGENNRKEWKDLLLERMRNEAAVQVTRGSERRFSSTGKKGKRG